jgi:hypothetical protein
LIDPAQYIAKINELEGALSNLKIDHTKQIDQLTKNHQKKIAELESKVLTCFYLVDNKFQASSSTQLAEREQQLEEELYNMKKQWDTTTRDLERAKGENVNLTVALEKLREEKEAAEDNELKSLEAYPLMMSIFIHVQQ